MRVLVVDDDLASCLITRAVVEALGHECVLTSDGEQAWVRYGEYLPDVLISDRLMPGVDGIELCRRVRAMPGDGYTYVILLTGLSSHQDVLTGMRAGADDYVGKPLDPHALEARLLAAERVTALHAQLAQARRKLERQARTDALTGLRNRLGLVQTMDALHRASRRSARGYSVAMCDVDQFKAYNDLYGHPAGDRALRVIADVLHAQVRDEDTVFRYGGEEFLVLLPQQDADQATVAMERVRTAVRGAGVEHRGSQPGVLTLSIGLAWCPADRDMTSAELLAEADAALYTAKRAGRDRIERSAPVVAQAGIS